MKKSWKVFVVFTVLATVLAIPGVALAHHHGHRLRSGLPGG